MADQKRGKQEQGPKQATAPARSGQFKPGASGNPAGRPRRDSRSTRKDGWYSLLGGLGTMSRDKRESFNFCADLVDWETALAIYRGDPMGARIVETKPNELVREGYDLCISDEAEDKDAPDDEADPIGILKRGKVEREVVAQRKVFGGKKTPGLDKVGKDLQEAVEERWEELELLPTIHEALCYENAYGGAAILIGANDGSSDMSKPLNVKAIRTIDFLTALEPRELQPVAWYANPQAPKYGRPAIYQLTPSVPGSNYTPPGQKPASASMISIHESRLIVFPGIRVTRRNLGTMGGWGDSIFTRVVRVLRDFNISWGAAGVLVADFAQAVYKMDGLNELLQEDAKDVFKNRIMGMELARSVARAVMIDSKDEFKREQTPVSGLPDLLDRFATALAAAADLPLPLLMGESPGGLNASGASGDQLRMFYDKIKSTQKRKVVPAIRRITTCIFQAMGGAPETWSIKPRPLWQLTEKESTELRKTQMEIDVGYMDHGVVSDKEVRESRFGGDAWSSETQIQDDDSDDDVDAAEVASYAAEQAAGKPDGGKIAPVAAGAGAAPSPGGKIAPVGAPSSGDGAAPGIQAQAMNGAQITSLLEVVTASNDKTISRESAVAILRLAFQLKSEDADAVLGPATFVAAKPEPPPSPFGGAPKPGGLTPPAPPPKPAAPDAPAKPVAPTPPDEPKAPE